MRTARPSQAAVGTHTVAWWDPNVLGLEAEENVGLRQQRILEADESGAEVARGEQAYIQWKEGRSAAVAQASQPTTKVQTATAFAARRRPCRARSGRIQIETGLARRHRASKRTPVWRAGSCRARRSRS